MSETEEHKLIKILTRANQSINCDFKVRQLNIVSPLPNSYDFLSI